MLDVQTCPRRIQEAGPWEHSENLDTWLQEARHEEGPTPYCSFCGSLHPEKFLELVTEGWVVEPTDKSYKAYLRQVLAMEERTAEPGEPLPPIACGRSKFYYQHLSEEQRQHFVDLYNDNTMRLGLPGYFYQMPFFMTVGAS